MNQAHRTLPATLLATAASLLLSTSVLAAEAKAESCNRPIQPCDCAWSMNVVSHETSGCPAMLAGAMESATASMLTMSNSANFDFDTPFHPKPLLAKNPNITREQTGRNEWKTLRFKEGTSTMITVSARLDVQATDRMQMESIFVMNLPPELAAILGGGGSNCRSVATVEYRAKGQCGVKSDETKFPALDAHHFADGTPEAKAAGAMVETLRARGLQPPADSGLSLRDYVTVESSTTEKALYVHLLASHDGRLLPRNGTIAEDPCHTFEPAANKIRFKAFLTLTEDADAPLMSKRRITLGDDGKQTSSRYRYEQRYYDTFAQHIDVETGKIERQQEVKVTEHLTLSEAFDASWDALELGATQMDDGYTD